jgi:hypothetical protein
MALPFAPRDMELHECRAIRKLSFVPARLGLRQVCLMIFDNTVVRVLRLLGEQDVTEPTTSLKNDNLLTFL